MTPAERAEKLFPCDCVMYPMTSEHYNGCASRHWPAVARAITAAVEAETERCAKVADGYVAWCGKMSAETRDQGYTHMQGMALEIADTIRGAK